MTDPEAAAENLRVIRNLMERATVYRAISAPTAIVAAFLSIAVAAGLGLGCCRPGPWAYFSIWIAVLVLIDAFNTFLLWRDARKRGDAILTPGLMHAIRSLAPPMFAGGVISLLVLDDSILLATLCWVVFYGLALIATHGFAPTSMKVLGTVFVFAGLGAWTALRLGWISGAEDQQLLASSLVMALTFGLFHLVYGLAIGVTTRFRISKRPKPE